MATTNTWLPSPSSCFNPRHPRGVATYEYAFHDTHNRFQSTPPAAWGGDTNKTNSRRALSFNPRHPRGVATYVLPALAARYPFQSTPPAWGGDSHRTPPDFRPWFQSTPPAWGGDPESCSCAIHREVSIHATRVGWRPVLYSYRHLLCKFQSTPPAAWGGDLNVLAFLEIGKVSIHATRVGWRRYWFVMERLLNGFNPRHPRGVATDTPASARQVSLFQSTPPAWGGDLCGLLLLF